MSKTPRRPGPESTLSDVRQQLIAAAIVLLRERGVDVGLRNISLSDAIAEAGVTRSTAYRSLADDNLAPQAVLHHELQRYLLTRYSGRDVQAALTEEISAELERQAANMASSDIAARTTAMRAIIRVGANRSYQDVVAAPERSVLIALYGALRSSGTTDWRYDALVEGERHLTASFVELYTGLSELFGYQIKPHLSVEQFTVAGASLVEGLAMRHGINEHGQSVSFPTGPDHEPETWSMFATAFEALYVGFFEPTSPDEPFADLLRF